MRPQRARPRHLVVIQRGQKLDVLARLGLQAGNAVPPPVPKGIFIFRELIKHKPNLLEQHCLTYQPLLHSATKLLPSNARNLFEMACVLDCLIDAFGNALIYLAHRYNLGITGRLHQLLLFGQDSLEACCAPLTRGRNCGGAAYFHVRERQRQD